MIMQRSKVAGIFRVRYKTPLKVKTLKEYKQFKETRAFLQKNKIILKDTEDEVLFIKEENST